MLKFRCRECDQKIGVPEEWAGKKVRCPRCAHAVPVPQVLEAVVRPGPAAGRAVKPVAPVTPKAPLMPMPPVRGKTVAVPHPAVKAKRVAKAPGAAPATPGVAKAPDKHEAGAEPARRRRAKAPEAAPPVVPPVVKPEPEPAVPSQEEPVQAKHEAVEPPEAEVQLKPAEGHEPKEEEAAEQVEAGPEARVGETPKSEAAAEVERPAEVERSPEVEPAGPTPEPVMVSAKRTTGEPIVMEAPKTADYSSLFADNVVGGVEGVGVDSQVDEPAPVEGATGAVSVESGEAVEARGGLISGPPLSEVMDALRGPEESGVTSSAAVSDIVKGLTKGEVEAEAEAPPPVRTEFRLVPESRPTAQFAPSPTAARALGVAAMLVGVGALALCVTPRWTRLALPVGALGLVVALMGAMAPARRRGTEVALAMGSAAVSLAGIVLAVLVATGVVPLAGAGGQLRGGPSARLGDVEVKVASAEVVRPVLYSAGGKVPKTDGQRVLRVDLEVRNLSGSGNVAYKSWGALRADVEPVILQDDEGNQLKLIDPAPKVPPGRPREFPTVIAGKSKGVCDVLLFEAPPADSHELDLQLPGSNVQARGAFSLHIPASMLRK